MKTDCFAYVEKEGYCGCKALTNLYCKDKECKFYKSKNEIDWDKIEYDCKRYKKL